MCLYTSLEEKIPKGVIEAFKIFDTTNEGKLFPKHRKEFKLTRGIWMKAKKKRLYYDVGIGCYNSGFHAYMFQSEAETEYQDSSFGRVVVKVKLRKVRIIGRQDGAIVYVADEMLIPRRKNA